MFICEKLSTHNAWWLLRTTLLFGLLEYTTSVLDYEYCTLSVLRLFTHFRFLSFFIGEFQQCLLTHYFCEKSQCLVLDFCDLSTFFKQLKKLFSYFHTKRLTLTYQAKVRKSTYRIGYRVLVTKSESIATSQGFAWFLEKKWSFETIYIRFALYFVKS